MGDPSITKVTVETQKKIFTSVGVTKPSEILNAIERSGGVINTRDLARTFGLKGDDRRELKATLKTMIEDGQLEQGHNRRSYRIPSTVPSVGIVEITSIDADGELIGRPISWKFGGSEPHITVTLPRRTRLRSPGLKERVLARLKIVDQNHVEAKILRHLGKVPDQIIGVVEKTSSGTRVQAISRQAPKQILLNSENIESVETGDVVAVTLDTEKTYGPLVGVLKQKLGKIDSPGVIERMVCAQFQIPSKFSEETLNLANKAGRPTLKGRVDLQPIPLVTIDDEDARDFDDAIWAAEDLDPNNTNGWHLIVAIADVAAYVKTGDALDVEAYQRGNSVYLPNMVVPMLPKSLSNGWCSLNPGEIRACIAVHIWIDKNGITLRYHFERAFMRSAARLTYTSVQKAYEGHPDKVTTPLMGQIKHLYGAFESLKKERLKRNTLDFDLPEQKVIFNDKNHIESIKNRPRFDSHRLIEEFMIAANVAAAQALTELNAPCIYRVHDQPPLSKLETLRSYLKALGYKLSKSRRMTPQNFQQILDKSKGTDHEHAIATVILRTQSQAEYSQENIGHFGLNLQRYSHFTSPIRRYSDLLVHRSLIKHLNLGQDGLATDEVDRFPQISDQVSKNERRATLAEREALDRYMAIYMCDKKGAIFDAKVNGVTRFGLFVSLTNIGAEGLIPMRVISSQLGERVSYNADKQIIFLRSTQKSYGLSQTISVRLDEVNMTTGQLTFSLSTLPAPGMNTTLRSSRRRKRR